MDMLNLNSFLKFGYFLKYSHPTIRLDFSNVDMRKYLNWDERELIKKGLHLYLESIEDNFNSHDQHVVPLSGGLDCRVILALLLKFTSADKIHTFTYGLPKTMDFEFGNRIAKKIGTRHTKMPLNTYRYNQEELIDISCRVDHQINLFYHPPIWDLDKLFSNGVILSGFFGGRSSGSYVFLENSKTLDEAKKRYINKNFVVNSVDLVYKEKDKLEELVEWPGYDPDKMNFDEQLDFVNRQLKNTAPNNLFRGFDFKTPFLYQPLLDFMLSLPKKMRYNQYLYKKIFIQNFPDLFSLPCKTTFGLPPSTGQFRSRFKQIHTSIRREIRRLFSSIPDPYLNYIAFNREIIEREDLNRIVYTNIMDLKRRNMLDWIDIDGIWDEHIHRNRDHTRALLVLASLEIHLKAGKTI